MLLVSLLLLAGILQGSLKTILLVGWLLIVLSFLVWASASIASGVYVDALICNRKKKNMIALSFDDGPNEATPQILDMLQEQIGRASCRERV